MNVRPLNDRVLVKRLEEEAKTAGGIYIPESAKEKPNRGKVVAVGSGRADDDGNRKPLDVKKDDEVLFGKYAGTEIKIEGEDLIIMREEDILAVVER
jgi:chaperonin GroES